MDKNFNYDEELKKVKKEIKYLWGLHKAIWAYEPKDTADFYRHAKDDPKIMKRIDILCDIRDSLKKL
jgi:hypothetical protein